MQGYLCLVAATACSHVQAEMEADIAAVSEGKGIEL